MRFINLVLQLVSVSCVINKKDCEYKTYYLIENPATGPFTYSKICKEFNITQDNLRYLNEDDAGKIEMYKIEDGNEYRGYLLKSNFGSYKPNKHRVNEKTKLLTLGPNFEIKKEGDNLLAIRSDFTQDNLPEVIEGIKLINWIFDSTSKTVNLIDDILFEIRNKKGIYKQLQTNEYILLFFKRDLKVIYDFFSSFRRLLLRGDKSLILRNLCKELDIGNLITDKTDLSRMYMDISNILSLAENPEYIFEIFNINSTGDAVKVKQAVLVTCNNIYRDIIILDRKGKELPILFLEKNENTVKLVLNLEEINDKSVTIACKTGIKITDLDLEEIRKTFN